MVLNPVHLPTSTIINDSGCLSADRGTLGHLGTWTPDEILNAVNVVKL